MARGEQKIQQQQIYLKPGEKSYAPNNGKDPTLVYHKYHYKAFAQLGMA